VERLLHKFECVRIVDMAGVDLDLLSFDFDLTFCLLLTAPDGRILHTFGGRDATGAESHLSLEALRRVLEGTLQEWDGRDRSVASNRPPPAGRTIEQIPVFARRRERGEAKGCVHCHTVFQMFTEEKREAGRFRNEDAWRWPDPIQVGLVLDREDQTLVKTVVAESPAARAGLKAGDHLRRADGAHLLSFGDLQRVLHMRDLSAGTLEIHYQRGEKSDLRARLSLGKGWKTPTPEVFAWRNSKWTLDPKPGFGGPDLTADEKRQAGIPPEDYAFRIKYLVDWGSEAHTGRAAAKAGLRKGDIVVSVEGRTRFESQNHFHAWFRLTRKPGETVEIVVLREKKRVVVALPLSGK
jgi:hypothetical protein